MKINFKFIKIENFKNIELLQSDFGNKTYIYGANETGKTSFADAISWCLTGKNSLGDSQFNFLPIGKNEVSPSVTIDIEIQDEKNVKPVTLTRTYQANVNRSKEFTGEYSTIYFINKLKVGSKEFGKWIEDHICTPEIFRLIHDVRYFTENITINGRERPWEAQRRLLFAIANINSDVSFAGTAKNKKRFELLLDGLARYDSANQYLTFLKSEEKRIEEEIKQTNERIYILSELIKDYDENLDNIDLTYEKLKNRYTELKNQIIEAERENKKNNKSFLNSYDDLIREKHETEFNLEVAKEKIEELKERYNDIPTVCPTCGQYMPTEEIVKQKEKIEQDIEKYMIRISDLEKNVKDIGLKLESKRKELDGENNNNSSNIQELMTEKDMITDKLLEISKKQEKIKQNESSKNSIIDLKNTNKLLLNQRAETAHLIDLCKEFIDVKCKYAEKKINDLFDGIKFKMFRKNKTNGEIRECCDLTWNGVPYKSLSYSTKFLVNMKIALAFQKFYGVEMPLIVDNAESIDFCQDIPIQSVFLVKREEYCKCGETTGRKEADGMWTCNVCRNRFCKTLEIVTE